MSRESSRGSYSIIHDACSVVRISRWIRATTVLLTRKSSIDITWLTEVFFGAAQLSKVTARLTTRRESGGIARESIIGVRGERTFVASAANLISLGSTFLALADDRIAGEATAITNVSRAALLIKPSTGLTNVGIGIAREGPTVRITLVPGATDFIFVTTFLAISRGGVASESNRRTDVVWATRLVRAATSLTLVFEEVTSISWKTGALT